MLSNAQSCACSQGERPGRFPTLLVVIAACVTLASCAGGMKLSKVDADPSLITNSVSPNPNLPTDKETVSDQTTIQNAVSSANLELLHGGALAWANTATDSRGSIFDIVEIKRSSQVCRSFKSSRESFEGVSLYSGEACTPQTGGSWYMRIFKLL